MKAKPVLILALLVLLAVVATYWRAGGSLAIAPGPETPAAPETPAHPTATFAGAPSADTPQPGELEALRERMQARYGAHLDHPKVQIQLLEELMRYLAELDPDHWRENLDALIQDWFPELADELRQRARALLAYQDFMDQERYTLRGMGPEERRDFIWAKRRELFGEDADRIWQSELRNQALSQSLQVLDQQPLSPLAKAEAYSQAIASTYGEQADQVLDNRRQELTDRFLTLPSIQQSLQGQAPQQRYATLRGIRQALGMDEPALERWDQLDRLRDQRWSEGQSYETQRQAIVERYPEGPERERALDALSRDTFGEDMAAIIRSEEAAGYYRYQQPRVYGQN